VLPSSQPGHWFEPVTELVQPGPAPPIRVELDPAQKKDKKEKKKFPFSFNPNFVDLSTCALVRNNIPFSLCNIYQYQN
jgi:hypothetical protein